MPILEELEKQVQADRGENVLQEGATADYGGSRRLKDTPIDSGPARTEGDSIEATTLEVGGIKVREIKDAKGRTWTVSATPADDSNIDQLEYRNLLSIPKKEPGFFYQYVTTDRLNEYLTQDFVLVDPDEIGLPSRVSDPGQEAANATVGVRPTTHHQVGNLHLVKTPEVLAKRFEAAHLAKSRAVVRDISVPRKLGKPIVDRGVEITQADRSFVKGKPFVSPAGDFPTQES